MAQQGKKATGGKSASRKRSPRPLKDLAAKRVAGGIKGGVDKATPSLAKG